MTTALDIDGGIGTELRELKTIGVLLHAAGINPQDHGLTNEDVANIGWTVKEVTGRIESKLQAQ